VKGFRATEAQTCGVFERQVSGQAHQCHIGPHRAVFGLASDRDARKSYNRIAQGKPSDIGPNRIVGALELPAQHRMARRSIRSQLPKPSPSNSSRHFGYSSAAPTERKALPQPAVRFLDGVP
jgi:hypothetical protein